MKLLTLTAFLVTASLLSVQFAGAQNTMYFMDRMPQSLNYNPALMPNVNFFLGLPGVSGVSASAYNSGFNYNELEDFIDNLGNENYDPDEFVKSMGSTNRFLSHASTNLLTFGFRIKDKVYLSFHYLAEMATSVDAESDIVYLLTDYKELSPDKFPIVVDGIDMKMNSYTRMGFTFAHQINDHLTLGISPNIHFNLAGVKTDNIRYTVRIEDYDDFGDPVFDESVNGTATIGLPTAINPDAINDGELDLDQGILPDGWEEDISSKEFFQNASFSLDLGATYELQKWMFSASVLDLGSSGWKKYGYQLTGDDDVIRVKEEKVKFSVPTRVYLGASRQFTPKWNYALLLNSNFYSGGANAAATLSLNGVVGRALSTSVSYTAGYKFTNLGLGLRLRFLPGTDLYFVTDNIIQAFAYKKAQRLTASVGLNLSFGIKDGLINESLDSPDSGNGE